MINRVVLLGRLVRDPELRTTSTGKSVCSFAIAVDKKFKPQGDGPTADFFKVSCWEKSADYAGTYLRKGQRCAVDGRLEQRSFIDKDGNKRETIEIVADSVQGLDRTDEQGNGARTSGATTQSPVDEPYDVFADE